MYVEYMDEKSEPNNNEVSQPYFHYSQSGILRVSLRYSDILYL